MSATVSWPLEVDTTTRGVLRAPRPGGRRPVTARQSPATRPVADRPDGSGRAPEGALRPGALRLTRRGRVLLAVVALMLACAGVVATGAAQAGAPHRGVEVTRHVVQPGETLWALAGSVASPREDLRDVVAEIEKLNNLDGAGLRAGEQLLLPVPRG